MKSNPDTAASSDLPSGRGPWLVLVAAFLGWMFDGFEMGLGNAIDGPDSETRRPGRVAGSLGVDVELDVTRDPWRFDAEAGVDLAVSLQIAFVTEARVAAHQVLVTDGRLLARDEDHVLAHEQRGQIDMHDILEPAVQALQCVRETCCGGVPAGS